MIIFFVLIVLTFLLVWYRFKINSRTVNNIEIRCDLLSELDRDVCNFVNYKSPYSVEEVSKKTLISTRGPISRLGLENVSSLEGLLLGYREFDSYILLIVGFDSITENSRFVTPLMIPSYAIEDNTLKISLSFLSLNNLDLSSSKEKITLKNKKEIIELLSKLKNKVLFLSLTDDKVNVDSVLLSSGNQRRLIEDVNNRVDVSKQLLSKVNSNNITSPYVGFQSNKLIEVKNVQDVNNIDNVSIINVPIIEPVITYFGG